jgi:hypothetical protein
MDRFEYKVLRMGFHTVLQIPDGWFDGDEKLGEDIDAAILNRYGAEGWEVCATIQINMGMTGKILLKRRRVA